MNINRGFELMIPKGEKKPVSHYKNQIRFQLFKKTYTITFEVKGE